MWQNTVFLPSGYPRGSSARGRDGGCAPSRHRGPSSGTASSGRCPGVGAVGDGWDRLAVARPTRSRTGAHAGCPRFLGGTGHPLPRAVAGRTWLLVCVAEGAGAAGAGRTGPATGLVDRIIAATVAASPCGRCRSNGDATPPHRRTAVRLCPRITDVLRPYGRRGCAWLMCRCASRRAVGPGQCVGVCHQGSREWCVRSAGCGRARRRQK